MAICVYYGTLKVMLEVTRGVNKLPGATILHPGARQ
jgi:hypothetical protein